MAKPVSEARVQEMIDQSLENVYQGSSPALNEIYYSRRETVKNEFGVSVLEEINAEDYKIQCARGGRGAFFWMDDNPGNANMVLDVNETGGYSKIHLNNMFLSLHQQDGVYHFNNLKTFADNDEAVAYFKSKGWNKIHTAWCTPDGDLKVTKPIE